CPVLLTKDEKTPEPFKHEGTPVAYLLDEQGRVAAPFANGADQVLALAQALANPEPAASGAGNGNAHRARLPGERPLAESRIPRDGLKAGTPAPGFRLPDLQGGTVSLEGYRGRRVLLVFSDPQCGPCDELAPHLAGLQREQANNGLNLIHLGRVDPQE